MFFTWSWIKLKIVHYNYRPQTQAVLSGVEYACRMQAVEHKHKKNVCWLHGGGQEASQLFFVSSISNPCPTPHTHTTSLPPLTFHVEFVMAVWLCHNVFFLFLLTAWEQFIFLSGDGGGWEWGQLWSELISCRSHQGRLEGPDVAWRQCPLGSDHTPSKTLNQTTHHLNTQHLKHTLQNTNTLVSIHVKTSTTVSDQTSDLYVDIFVHLVLD